jgi:hypothetical protein
MDNNLCPAKYGQMIQTGYISQSFEGATGPRKPLYMGPPYSISGHHFIYFLRNDDQNSYGLMAARKKQSTSLPLL